MVMGHIKKSNVGETETKTINKKISAPLIDLGGIGDVSSRIRTLTLSLDVEDKSGPNAGSDLFRVSMVWDDSWGKYFESRLPTQEEALKVYGEIEVQLNESKVKIGSSDYQGAEEVAKSLEAYVQALKTPVSSMIKVVDTLDIGQVILNARNKPRLCLNEKVFNVGTKVGDLDIKTPCSFKSFISPSNTFLNEDLNLFYWVNAVSGDVLKEGLLKVWHKGSYTWYEGVKEGDFKNLVNTLHKTAKDYGWYYDDINKRWDKVGGVTKQAVAPTEVSLPVFSDLLGRGYDTATFLATGEHCDICTGHDGESKALQDLIDGANFEAPIYTWSHPGCNCTVVVSGGGNEEAHVTFAGLEGASASLKKGTIPEMKSTQDAIAYGKTIKGNQEAISELKTERAKLLKEFKVLMEKGDEDSMRGASHVSFKTQLLREAYETAEGVELGKGLIARVKIGGVIQNIFFDDDKSMTDWLEKQKSKGKQPEVSDKIKSKPPVKKPTPGTEVKPADSEKEPGEKKGLPSLPPLEGPESGPGGIPAGTSLKVKKVALQLSRNITSHLPDEAVKKLENDEIPVLTLAGGTLDEFGGPEKALVYRVWVHGTGGDDALNEFDTKEKAEQFIKDNEGAEKGVIAVVWDDKEKDFREVNASLKVGEDGKPKQDDEKSQLEIGKKIEMEHVETIKKVKESIEGGKEMSDEEVAEMIAKDHLKEDSQYYTKLVEMEKGKKASYIIEIKDDKSGNILDSKTFEEKEEADTYADSMLSKINQDIRTVIFTDDEGFIYENFGNGWVSKERELEKDESLKIKSASIESIEKNLARAKEQRKYFIEKIQEKGNTPEQKEKYQKGKDKWEKEIDRYDRQLAQALKDERRQEKDEANKKKEEEAAAKAKENGWESEFPEHVGNKKISFKIKKGDYGKMVSGISAKDIWHDGKEVGRKKVDSDEAGELFEVDVEYNGKTYSILVDGDGNVVDESVIDVTKPASMQDHEGETEDPIRMQRTPVDRNQPTTHSDGEKVPGKGGVVTKEQEKAIKDAVDYIGRVTLKQERLLPFEELYKGYKSIGGGLTEQGFRLAYDNYKDVLKEKGHIDSALKKTNDEVEEVDEPQEGDIVMSDSSPLGSKTSVSEVGGKFLGEFNSEDEAEDFIREYMSKSKNFFPTVWYMSDHGNYVVRDISKQSLLGKVSGAGLELFKKKAISEINLIAEGDTELTKEKNVIVSKIEKADLAGDICVILENYMDWDRIEMIMQNTIQQANKKQSSFQLKVTDGELAEIRDLAEILGIEIPAEADSGGVVTIETIEGYNKLTNALNMHGIKWNPLPTKKENLDKKSKTFIPTEQDFEFKIDDVTVGGTPAVEWKVLLKSDGDTNVIDSDILVKHPSVKESIEELKAIAEQEAKAKIKELVDFKQEITIGDKDVSVPSLPKQYRGKTHATLKKKALEILDGEYTYDCFLVDEGTLDTAIQVGREGYPSKIYRYDAEFASEYRDESGAMTDEGFKELCRDAIDAYETEIVEENIQPEKEGKMESKNKTEEIKQTLPGAGPRRFGKPRTDVGRVMRHFKVNEEEAKKMIKEKGVDKLLPPRGTGLGRERVSSFEIKSLDYPKLLNWLGVGEKVRIWDSKMDELFGKEKAKKGSSVKYGDSKFKVVNIIEYPTTGDRIDKEYELEKVAGLVRKSDGSENDEIHAENVMSEVISEAKAEAHDHSIDESHIYVKKAVERMLSQQPVKEAFDKVKWDETYVLDFVQDVVDEWLTGASLKVKSESWLNLLFAPVAEYAAEKFGLNLDTNAVREIERTIEKELGINVIEFEDIPQSNLDTILQNLKEIEMVPAALKEEEILSGQKVDVKGMGPGVITCVSKTSDSIIDTITIALNSGRFLLLAKDDKGKFVMIEPEEVEQKPGDKPNPLPGELKYKKVEFDILKEKK